MTQKGNEKTFLSTNGYVLFMGCPTGYDSVCASCLSSNKQGTVGKQCIPT